MKKILKQGFTLVELLIVIAIIGILAVGILLALDPVEQTRRASDANSLQALSDVKQAIDRYYASKLYYPWCTGSANNGDCNFQGGCAVNTAYSLGATCGLTAVTALTTTSELRQAPTQSLYLYIYTPAGGSVGTGYRIGFVPVSKSYQTNANSNWSAAANAQCSVVAGSATVASGFLYCQ